MGQVLTTPPKWTPRQAADYLEDLRDDRGLVVKKMLWSGRFMKTLECMYEGEGEVIAKVYLKRDDKRELHELRQALQRTRESGRRLLTAAEENSHVWPFQMIEEGNRAVYLLRQKAKLSLAERIASRPFLLHEERKWIAFQLLNALAQSHERGVAHGDVKTENCMLTSWSWLFLVDYAHFKPANLPSDNPAAFSFFYDTGGRRRCYLAPEKFYSEDADGQTLLGTEGSWGMHETSADIFSAGCVIAELFLDGQALFDLSQLLSYARSEMDMSYVLSGLRDKDCRELVGEMIQVDPMKRPSALNCLETQRGKLFPQYFWTPLRVTMGRMLHQPPDERVNTFVQNYHIVRDAISSNYGNEAR